MHAYVARAPTPLEENPFDTGFGFGAMHGARRSVTSGVGASPCASATHVLTDASYVKP